MSASMVAITMDEKLLRGLNRLVAQRHFFNPSRAVQKAVEEKLERLQRSRPPETIRVNISQVRRLSAVGQEDRTPRPGVSRYACRRISGDNCRLTPR